MTHAVKLRFAVLVAILLVIAVHPAYAAIEAGLNELRTRLKEAKDTEDVVAIVKDTIRQGEDAIAELRNQVNKLESEKAELRRTQTALTNGLIGALITVVITISGFVFRVLSSKVDRDLRRLEVMEKLSELESKGVSIPVDIRTNYKA